MKQLKAWAKRHRYEYKILYANIGTPEEKEIGILITTQAIEKGQAKPDYSKRNKIIDYAYKNSYRAENRAHYEAIAVYA